MQALYQNRKVQACIKPQTSLVSRASLVGQAFSLRGAFSPASGLLLLALTCQAEDLFTNKLYPVLEKAQCRACHNDNGVASGTKLRFPPEKATPDQINQFGHRLRAFINTNKPEAATSPKTHQPNPTHRRRAHPPGKRRRKAPTKLGNTPQPATRSPSIRKHNPRNRSADHPQTNAQPVQQHRARPPWRRVPPGIQIPNRRLRTRLHEPGGRARNVPNSLGGLQ